jgi:ferritin-like protein
MDKVAQIVAELKIAYATQLEIVQNYLADASNLKGPDTVKELLDQEVQTALGHARRIAKRIRALEGQVPRSPDLSTRPGERQPSFKSASFQSVLLSALKTQDSVITEYERIIQLCDGQDFVTLDLIIELLVAERDRRHRLALLHERVGETAKRRDGETRGE